MNSALSNLEDVSFCMKKWLAPVDRWPEAIPDKFDILDSGDESSALLRRS